MTAVATALANDGGSSLEWVLAIEGIGWADTLAAGFNGLVFASNDINGDLATRLGCTVKTGLAEPSGLSSQADLTKVEFKPGTMGFEILETEDDDLESIFRPLVNETTQSYLNEDVTYRQTVFEVASGVQFAVGDTFWIAGRELCLVTARAAVGAGVYDMTVTRGYLGTPIGRRDHKAIDATGFKWDDTTKVFTSCKFLHDRRVSLYAHVPGTAATEMDRVYIGRLRPIDTKDGVTWRLDTVVDSVTRSSRIREAPKGAVAVFMQYVTIHGRPASVDAQPSGSSAGSGTDLSNGTDPNDSTVGARHVRVTSTLKYQSDFEKYCVAFAYNYRWSPSNGGGTGNIKAAIDSDDTDPQAWEGWGGSAHRLDCMLNIGGEYVFAEKMIPTGNYLDLMVGKSPYGQGQVTDFGLVPAQQVGWRDGVPVKFLLDNVKDEWQCSRFALDREVRRNPCDVLAMFLTSMNSEFFLADAAAGGTTTTIVFTAPGFTVDEWVGYAVFCVEGGNATNRGYARKILSNTATTLTVEAFPYVPVAGAEYQIRNTIYDVLPLGWGKCEHNQDIDCESLEDIKTKYLHGADLGRFAIGDTDGFDIWKVVAKNICQPYGLLPSKDPATGKLGFIYIGSTIPDGVIDDYVSIADNQVYRLEGPKYSSETPIARILLKVRDKFTAMVSPVIKNVGVFGPRVMDYEEGSATDVGFNGKAHEIEINNNEIDFGYHPDDVGTLEVSALFNSEEDAAWLTLEHINRIKSLAIHPAVYKMDVSQEFMLTVRPGVMLSVTYAKAIDPYSGGRGWTNQLCRVFEAREQRKGKACLELGVIALDSVDAVRIAPACLVTGNGVKYYTVEELEYSSDSDVPDYDLFAVGDRIEQRDKSGALVTTHEIESIDDTNHRIYVVAAGTPAITAGDYLVFKYWCGGCATTNEELFAFLGWSDGLLDGADEAAEWT